MYDSSLQVVVVVAVVVVVVSVEVEAEINYSLVGKDFLEVYQADIWVTYLLMYQLNRQKKN